MGTAQSTSLERPFEYLAPGDLARLLKDGAVRKRRVVVVDVRDSDFRGGHIAGAQNICEDEFQDDGNVDAVVSRFAGAQAVVFHCMMSQCRGPFAASRYAAGVSRALDDGGDGDGAGAGAGAGASSSATDAVTLVSFSGDEFTVGRASLGGAAAASGAAQIAVDASTDCVRGIAAFCAFAAQHGTPCGGAPLGDGAAQWYKDFCAAMDAPLAAELEVQSSSLGIAPLHRLVVRHQKQQLKAGAAGAASAAGGGGAVGVFGGATAQPPAGQAAAAAAAAAAAPAPAPKQPQARQRVFVLRGGFRTFVREYAGSEPTFFEHYDPGVWEPRMRMY